MGDPPKSPTPNFYSILGIPKTASLADIGKAYKSLVMKWHPDRNPSNKAEAEAKFRSINEAYQVLSLKEKGRSKCRKSKQDKEEKKSDDDEELHISSPTLLSRNTSRISPKPSPRDLSHSTSQGSTTTSMDFYASQPKSPTGASNLSAPTTPMEPIEKKLECTLKELCHGCVKKKKITRDVISNTGRGDMTLLDDIKYPGYEKLVPGQGMPKSKKDGDLCLKFLVELSTELSNEQRIEVVSILQECFRALNSLFFKS